LFGREYINILSNKNNIKEKDSEVISEDELYYEENELSRLPDELRELLDCSVDLCKIDMINYH